MRRGRWSIWEMDEVFSVSGGRPWSAEEKVRDESWMEEVGGREERRYWMLRGVVAMVMEQWGFRCSMRLARARKGMK